MGRHGIVGFQLVTGEFIGSQRQQAAGCFPQGLVEGGVEFARGNERGIAGGGAPQQRGHQRQPEDQLGDD